MHPPNPAHGTRVRIAGTFLSVVELSRGATEEETMPVLLLWAVPAIVVVGGGVYLISHMH
jgi:hypothetical protein